MENNYPKTSEQYHQGVLQNFNLISKEIIELFLIYLKQELNKKKINIEIFNEKLSNLIHDLFKDFIKNNLPEIVNTLNENESNFLNFDFSELKDYPQSYDVIQAKLSSKGENINSIEKEMKQFFFLIEEIEAGLNDSALTTYSLFCIEKKSQEKNIKFNKNPILFKFGKSNLSNLFELQDLIKVDNINLTEIISGINTIQTVKSIDKTVGCPIVLFSPNLVQKYIEILDIYFEKIYQLSIQIKDRITISDYNDYRYIFKKYN